MITFWHCIIQKLNKGKNNPVQTSAQFKAQKEFSYILSNSNFRVFSVKMMSSWRGSSDSNPHRNLTSMRTLLRCLKKVWMRLRNGQSKSLLLKYLLFHFGTLPNISEESRSSSKSRLKDSWLPNKPSSKQPSVWEREKKPSSLAPSHSSRADPYSSKRSEFRNGGIRNARW